MAPLDHKAHQPFSFFCLKKPSGAFHTPTLSVRGQKGGPSQPTLKSAWEGGLGDLKGAAAFEKHFFPLHAKGCTIKHAESHTPLFSYWHSPGVFVKNESET